MLDRGRISLLTCCVKTGSSWQIEQRSVCWFWNKRQLEVHKYSPDLMKQINYLIPVITVSPTRCQKVARRENEILETQRGRVCAVFYRVSIHCSSAAAAVDSSWHFQKGSTYSTSFRPKPERAAAEQGLVDSFNPFSWPPFWNDTQIWTDDE